MLKHRSIPVCIVLSIITCGIYGLYWMVMLTDEVNAVSETQGTSGALSLVFTIITCGIYGYYWAWVMGSRLDNARTARGIGTGYLAVVFLVLNIFGLSIVTMAIMQSELNKYTPAL